MNVDEIQEAISGLWSEEFHRIKELREERQKQANALKASWSTATGALESAEELRDQSEALLVEHSRALLADDDEEAARVKAHHRDLEDRADSLEEQAATAFQTLRDAGVEGRDRKAVERSLEARIVALETRSREEIETLERVGEEVQELVNAILDRGGPFVNALPTGALKTQATGFQLQKTG